MFAPAPVRRTFVTAASLVAVFALAACSDSSGPTREVETTDADLNIGLTFDQAGVASVALGSTMGGPLGADGRTGGPATGSPETCTFTNGARVCSFQREGLTFTRRITFRDAAGATQERPDSLTTASITTETRVQGTHTRTGDRGTSTITVNRGGRMVLSGLAGRETQHVLNGAEGGTVESVTESERGTVRSVQAFADSSINVTIRVPRTRENHWPLSGTAVRAHSGRMSVNGEARPAFTMRAVTTFNGTNLVPVVVTDARGTRTCSRDLATGQTICERR